MRIASFFKSLFFLLRIDETFNNQLAHPLYATDKKIFYIQIKSTATLTKFYFSRDVENLSPNLSPPLPNPLLKGEGSGFIFFS
jgi:hypothetical protein